MSGQVFDQGSVMGFKPTDPFEVESWLGDQIDPPVKKMEGLTPVYDLQQERAYGWAMVVTFRDTWVVETQVEPMVVCCGGLVPLKTHGNSHHGAPKGTSEAWYWRMKH